MSSAKLLLRLGPWWNLILVSHPVSSHSFFGVVGGISDIFQALVIRKMGRLFILTLLENPIFVQGLIQINFQLFLLISLRLEQAVPRLPRNAFFRLLLAGRITALSFKLIGFQRECLAACVVWIWPALSVNSGVLSLETGIVADGLIIYVWTWCSSGSFRLQYESNALVLRWLGTWLRDFHHFNLLRWATRWVGASPPIFTRLHQLRQILFDQVVIVSQVLDLRKLVLAFYLNILQLLL